MKIFLCYRLIAYFYTTKGYWQYSRKKIEWQNFCKKTAMVGSGLGVRLLLVWEGGERLFLGIFIYASIFFNVGPP